jgi:hypothetical protein
VARPNAESPRALPTSRVQKLRFLKLYEEFGADYPTLREFCDALGLSYGYFRKLRARDAEFIARCKRLEERWKHSDSTSPKSMAPVNARRRWPNLDYWKALWLERYRETVDRMQACEIVDRTWSDVEAELAQDLAFAGGRDQVDEEILARIEDQHRRDALRGRGAAANQVLRRAKPAEDAKEPPPGDYTSDEAKRYYAELVAKLNASQVGERTEGAYDAPAEPAAAPDDGAAEIDPQHGINVTALAGDDVDELANDAAADEAN